MSLGAASRWAPESTLRRTLVAAPFVYAAHNLEESVAMARWAARELPALLAELRDSGPEPLPGAGALLAGLHPPTAHEFWVAAAVATVVPLLICVLALARGPASAWTRVAVWLQAIFCVNVFIPHLLGTLWLRGYTPGVVTAVVLNLPLSVVMLRAAVLERVVTRRAMRVFAVSALLCIAAFGLVLLGLARIAFELTGSG